MFRKLCHKFQNIIYCSLASFLLGGRNVHFFNMSLLGQPPSKPNQTFHLEFCRCLIQKTNSSVGKLHNNGRPPNAPRTRDDVNEKWGLSLRPGNLVECGDGCFVEYRGREG